MYVCTCCGSTGQKMEDRRVRGDLAQENCASRRAGRGREDSSEGGAERELERKKSRKRGKNEPPLFGFHGATL
jgi:hypothetical protein